MGFSANAHSPLYTYSLPPTYPIHVGVAPCQSGSAPFSDAPENDRASLGDYPDTQTDIRRMLSVPLPYSTRMQA